MTDIQTAVSPSYPGRSIIIGASSGGTHALIAYFIMGRSVNSRNRIFVKDGSGLRTQAHDPAKLSDPSLVIYAPVKVFENHTIVTNGDQTDTIDAHLRAGKGFEEALRTRTFEPDAPHYTPRVSAMVTVQPGTFSYRMALLKSAKGNPAACLRFFYEYETPLPGQGHFLHTYEGDGDPLPSFSGEPETVALPDDVNTLADALWHGMDEENKVSLFVRSIRLSDGAFEDRLINKLS